MTTTKEAFLVIVGNVDEAIAAAERHGVSAGATFVSVSNRRGTYCWSPSATWRELSAWFCEDAGQAAPFPVGSLLWYREARS